MQTRGQLFHSLMQSPKRPPLLDFLPPSLICSILHRGEQSILVQQRLIIPTLHRCKRPAGQNQIARARDPWDRAFLTLLTCKAAGLSWVLYGQECCTTQRTAGNLFASLYAGPDAVGGRRVCAWVCACMYNWLVCACISTWLVCTCMFVCVRV